jgi:diphthine-ammonia ligase
MTYRTSSKHVRNTKKSDLIGDSIGKTDERQHIAPVLFLVVKALPKDALLEKQAVLHTGRCLIPDSDDEPSMQLRVPTFHQGAPRLSIP